MNSSYRLLTHPLASMGLGRSFRWAWLFAAWVFAAPEALGAVKTCTFAGITSPSSTHVARAFEVDVLEPEDPPSANDIDTLTDDGTASGTPALRTGISGYSNDALAAQSEYDAIESSDDSRWQIPQPGSGTHACFWARFGVGLDPSRITQIDVTLEGYQASASDKAWLGIWRPGASTPYWEVLEASQQTSDHEYTGQLTSSLSEYLDAAGDLHIIFFNETADASLYIDYVEVAVTWSCGTGAFDYRRSLTIDSDLVGTDDSGTLPSTGFPVLVSLDAATSGNWLKNTSQTGGRIKSPKGWDIIFRDADENTLYHEIEKYDGTNGILVAWVRIDSLSKASDTTIYIHYGNDCLDAPTESPENVWDASDAMIHHLEEPSFPAIDSTSHSNDSTSDPGNPAYGTTGKIGEGVEFDGDDDQIDVPNDTTLVIAGDITISVWAYRDTDTTHDYFVDFAVSGDEESGNHLYECYIGSNDKLYIEWEYGDGTNEVVSSSVEISTLTGAWMNWVIVRNTSSQSVFFYENGSQLGTAQSYTNDATGGASGTLTIGFPSSGAYGRWDGVLDEIRISSTKRDADWIATCYNNQNAPGSFITLGSESGPGVLTAVTVANFEATRDGDDVLVAWETAQEIDNLGFHLYGSHEREGPFSVLTDRLIPGSLFSFTRREYRFLDRDAAAGGRRFYLLEAVDIFSNRTHHGPICVDWDGDGHPDDFARFVRGDLNGNGRFDLGDVVAILAHAFRDGEPPSCAKAADLDDDGGVNLDDALLGLRYLFLAGPEPKAPFPGCGYDPTIDALPCEAHSPCR
ncbi:MAG: DUF2341 domain-containing protein [Planctomycetes bacterium]|nr:DUF2341 domain-containing protein [Planctomycetota bacterium]